MALSSAGLKSSLESAFASPSSTAPGCGLDWGSAVGGYAASVVPACTTVAAAQATLGAALGAAFATTNGIAAMEAAFLAFAGTVAGGMAPAFVATPPAGPVGFASYFASAQPEAHAQAAQDISDLIHSWMTTGTATPSGGGSAVPWS